MFLIKGKKPAEVRGKPALASWPLKRGFKDDFSMAAAAAVDHNQPAKDTPEFIQGRNWPLLLSIDNLRLIW